MTSDVGADNEPGSIVNQCDDENALFPTIDRNFGADTTVTAPDIIDMRKLIAMHIYADRQFSLFHDLIDASSYR